MIKIGRLSRILVIAGLLLAVAGPSAAAALKLQAVVLLMRHGVRPPTKAQPLPEGFASDPWPSWPVAPGWLTPHGAQAVTLLGRYDRSAWAGRGLLPTAGCAASLDVWADVDERTVKSAEAWLEGFAPGCRIAVLHADGDSDPLFSPSFDSGNAVLAINQRMGPGGIQAKAVAQRARLDLLGKVLGCCRSPACPPVADTAAVSACDLTDLPTEVRPGRQGRASLEGALDIGSTGSQILMLEYTEGRPMSEVGWGRVTREQIEDLLALHAAQYDILIRPPFVGRSNAGPIAQRMLKAISAPGARRPAVTVLLGHDTNIASLGSMLDLHWKVKSFPVDDPPPGGALGFERLADSKGRAFVRVFYRSQTMDQMRNLAPLTARNPPSFQYLKVPGCQPTVEGACPLERFKALVEGAARPASGSRSSQ